MLENLLNMERENVQLRYQRIRYLYVADLSRRGSIAKYAIDFGLGLSLICPDF